MERIRARRCLFTLAIAASVACGGEPDGPDSNGNSTLRFAYSGDISGTFVAEGRPTRRTSGTDQFLEPTDYAVALSYPANSIRAGTLSVIANKAAADGSNVLLFGGMPARRTTAALSPSVGGLLHLGLIWNFSAFQPRTTYVLEAGSVTVTDYTPSRVRGTFQGTAFWSAPGVVDRGRIIRITGGRFDLAIDDTAAVPLRCALFAC
jgi:hypothetical protein